MKNIVKFAGWVVGVVIVVLDLVAYLGMPWTPDLSNPMDKWALFCISIITFAACFAAGWYQRGQKDLDENQLAGKQAALDNERRKNAELARRWEELNSEERRKREVFDLLNDREKWCLSHVWTTHPRKFSISGDLFVSDFRTLTDLGMLRFDGDEVHGGETRSVYAISFEWRKWIAAHANELPEPTQKAPS